MKRPHGLVNKEEARRYMARLAREWGVTCPKVSTAFLNAVEEQAKRTLAIRVQDASPDLFQKSIKYDAEKDLQKSESASYLMRQSGTQRTKGTNEHESHQPSEQSDAA